MELGAEYDTNGHQNVNYDEKEDVCEHIEQHVKKCRKCIQNLSFNPIEKALLKSYSIKNDIMELVVFIATGVLLIIILRMILYIKGYSSA